MMTYNYSILIYLYCLLTVMVLLTWCFVKKSEAHSVIRREMGKHFISLCKWIIITEAALCIFIPEATDWILIIGIGGFAALCALIGICILNTVKDSDESENTIVVTFEEHNGNYSATVSNNVPGGLTFTADSFMELFDEAEKVILSHIERMLKDGEEVPEWLVNGEYDYEFVPSEKWLPIKITMKTSKAE